VRNFSQIQRTTPVILLENKRLELSYNGIRFASSETPSFDTIPEPPAIPEIVVSPTPTQDIVEKAIESTQAVIAGAEPAFTSIGLGGWSPPGLVQSAMEFLHISCDVPWWGTILIGTICVRVLIFPLVIMAQRNGAKLANHMPQMQVLQAKMTEARQSGNAIDAARYSQALVEFMKEKKVNPLKNMIVPLAQAPLFVSFFIGLRQMANTPVESMRDGGLFWFTDLTVPDQFFLLPIITSLTMLATIEVGTDGARLQHQNMQTMKYVLRALPFVIFPFTMNFPGAIVTYWTFSNIISLIQVAFLKIPAVREYFKIDKIVINKTAAQAGIKKKGFVEGVKDSWTNMKITRELEERKRVDEIAFQRAAQGAIQKTYKFDPTKPKPATAVSAKKR
jgi:YidC/Oxa1 family membrane protein insertase